MPQRAVDPLDKPWHRAARRIDDWLRHFVVHHTTLEWLIGLVIMLVWAVIAFASLGLLAGFAAVLFGVVLHFVAMETGSHVWLWFATAAVLVYALVAYSAVLEPLGPLMLAVGGASALAYNESVRVNYSRRRGAKVDSSVFTSSVLAVVVATITGMLGVGLAIILNNQVDRDWLWMPAAVLTLIAVAYALVILPTVRAPEISHHRWEPGTRIPPQPLGTDTRSASIPAQPAWPTGRSGGLQPPPP